ncbi:MAG: hypothetical protein LBS05_07070 [Tannerellaceae bacterium]|nr:hypothetical protein [Tannerellaceae bacterium]
MKRTFLIILFALVALYAKITYDLWTAGAPAESSPHGYLSEIASRVTAIPLQTGEQRIENPRSIRREGTNLFLISNDILYRFNLDGEFLCRITDPALIRVATYLIDPLRSRLIILGNADDIHYYTFGGELLEQQKADARNGLRSMKAVTFYQDQIWAAEERTVSDPLTRKAFVEQQLVRYDASFREIGSHRLLAAGLPEQPVVPFSGEMHLAVMEDTGALYACTPSLHPERLLQDSLRLKYGPASVAHFPDAVHPETFPLRFGRRFWFSSAAGPDGDSEAYLYCFDRTTDRSWLLKGGFDDDFYHTGPITGWQAMDVYSRAYCFCQSGDPVKPLSPSGSPVVFIVELNV